MNLKLKYFGMIAEAVGKEQEELNIAVQRVADLHAHFSGQLNAYSYKIAVNQVLANDEVELQENDEVAFLPPFAGG